MSIARPPGGGLVRDRGDLPQRVVSANVSLRQRVVEIWGARELLVFLVRKELKVRYKNSALGFLWSFLNPALVLMIYYVVFKYFLHNPTPDFALFLFAGLLPWNVFNNSLLSASGVLVAHAGIVKKVAFPREVLALAQVGTAISYFFFQTCILALFLAGFRVLPAWGYLPLLFFALICDIIFSAALAVFLSAVNVYLRDVQHLVEVLLVALFFSPPIVYAFSNVSHALHDHAWFRWLYEANPLMWIVVAFQRCLFGRVIPPAGKVVPSIGPTPYHVLPTWGATPYWVGLSGVFVGSLALLLFAMLIFGRVEGNFAEEL
ncbi:MAG: ABC transporter permease [Actinomycetota bacterium]|nr:ABC transporter permease [Actinomycetota bacterium]